MAKIRIKDQEREVKNGEMIMEACKEMGILFACEDGQCGTCLVSVLKGQDKLSELTQEEKDFLLDDESKRLACQCKIKSGEIVLEPY